MSTHMKQVTKEEFEVLTRFHPGEIRYMVDTNKVIYRRKGAAVTVSRKATAPKKKRKSGRSVVAIKPGVGRGGNSTQRPKNAPMQLVTSSHEFKEGSLSVALYRLVKLKFERDPTKVIGRTDLVAEIVDTSIYAPNQVGPFVSDCVKRGILRYTGEQVRA